MSKRAPSNGNEATGAHQASVWILMPFMCVAPGARWVHGAERHPLEWICLWPIDGIRREHRHGLLLA